MGLVDHKQWIISEALNEEILSPGLDLQTIQQEFEKDCLLHLPFSSSSLL